MRERLRHAVRYGYKTYLLGAAAILVVAALSGAAVGLFDGHANRKGEPRVQTGKDGAAVVAPSQKAAPSSRYVEVIESCGPAYEGTCVNVRSGPGLSYPVVAKLRHGIVLKVSGVKKADGHTWYRIVFDEWVRYPDRIAKEWYVAGDYLRTFEDNSAGELEKGARSAGTKRIIVDRTVQRIFAYDGDELFMDEPISTGLELTPTPRGIFHVYKKTPTRYMQGPLPGISDQYYDLPGVPWNLYFTNEGGAIHGAYWHDKFGQPWSHGCVNLPLEKARALYYWADLGTTVIVQD